MRTGPKAFRKRVDGQTAFVDLTHGSRLPDEWRCDPGCILVNRIWVPPSARGTGVGSELLRRVMRKADAAGAWLMLNPAQIDQGQGLDSDALRQWYERHGFVFDQELSGRWARTIMVRPPDEQREVSA